MSEQLSYAMNPSDAEKKEAEQPTSVTICSGETEAKIAPEKGWTSEFHIRENLYFTL